MSVRWPACTERSLDKWGEMGEFSEYLPGSGTTFRDARAIDSQSFLEVACVISCAFSVWVCLEFFPWF